MTTLILSYLTMLVLNDRILDFWCLFLYHVLSEVLKGPLLCFTIEYSPWSSVRENISFETLQVTLYSSSISYTAVGHYGTVFPNA